MPTWLQLLIGIGGGIAALTAIWTKLIRPLGSLIVYMQDALPLLGQLVTLFKDTPSSLKVLQEIANEFKTNSGTSLRDVVDRLEDSVKDSRISAQILKENVEAVRQLAAQDRAHAAQRDVVLAALTERVERIDKRSPAQ